MQFCCKSAWTPWSWWVHLRRCARDRLHLCCRAAEGEGEHCTLTVWGGGMGIGRKCLMLLANLSVMAVCCLLPQKVLLTTGMAGDQLSFDYLFLFERNSNHVNWYIVISFARDWLRSLRHTAGGILFNAACTMALVLFSLYNRLVGVLKILQCSICCCQYCKNIGAIICNWILFML
jgi:hypothetical protein